jgi:hypothetical protein
MNVLKRMDSKGLTAADELHGTNSAESQQKTAES